MFANQQVGIQSQLHTVKQSRERETASEVLRQNKVPLQGAQVKDAFSDARWV